MRRLSGRARSRVAPQARTPLLALPAPATLLVLLLAAGLPAAAGAQEPYRLPPAEIVKIMDAPPLPSALVSPDNSAILLVERPSMPSVAEVGQPMLRLAGYRINPRTNGSARTNGDIDGLKVETVPDGTEHRIQVPDGSTLGSPEWSPDGKAIAFTRTTADAVELWVADPRTGAARRLTDAPLNAVAGDPCVWTPDSAALICRFVVDGRGAPPSAPHVPAGPTIEQSLGDAAPVPTYEDLLTDAHDEALFDYYFTSRLARVDVATGARTPIGEPGVLDDVAPSPDGRFLLVTRTVRPYSYHVPEREFPKEIEVWAATGERVRTIASLPLSEIPWGMVRTGPRSIDWRPSGATLVWPEAVDGGDPSKPADYRDHVVQLAAPFTGEPVELIRTPERVSSIVWAGDDLALVSQYDRKKAWTRTWLVDADHPEAAARLIPAFDRSSEARYGDPGRPVLKPGTGGYRGGEAVRRGNAIFLAGDGASPEGERPFLDRLDLKTFRTRRVWRSGADRYESVVALLGDDGARMLTRRESASEPPNYFVRSGGRTTALTHFEDPAPRFTRGVKKQLVVYRRSDGLPLNGMLYLPPDYTPGTPLPTILWAYPREFVSADAAGQVSASTNRFTLPQGAGRMHLLLALQGYAVFDGPSMPILGGDTANNHYVDQLVDDARAAIDKLAEMGVTDPDRVGVGGHSYGAFMTANLLTHSKLFRAGVAESGAYNRTLTPFGFQNERRFYWQIPDIYDAMSPFQNADSLSGAILLTHGMNDDNSGTFPIQSERYYAALKGLGKTVRFVYLPFEAHGYRGRENVLDVFAEELAWFDRYVKAASSAVMQ